MMISDKDITDMENDVMDTIMDWHCTATISVPKPIDQQINWDSRLHEFHGAVLYDTYTDVPVERIDGYFNKEKIDVAGDMDTGSVVLYVPLRYNKDGIITELPISGDDIDITLDGEQWRVKSYKELIGEYLLNIRRKVGGS